MYLQAIKKLSLSTVNKIRAEIKSVNGLPYQVSYINLDTGNDPSATLKRNKRHLTILSDKHSYPHRDRIFPINQDENSVFAQYVYRDSLHHAYGRVLDLATGSGVIAMAAAKAGATEVIATDINERVKDFINKNNALNEVNVYFLKSDLFYNIKGTFDKVTINPPFMPAPGNTFPLHAQGGSLGTENVVEPFFKNVWKYMNKGGCIQGIFHSFASKSQDTILHVINKYIPRGWSYTIKHVFPIKNVPIELYMTAFIGHKGYPEWAKKIKNGHFHHMRFFMVTLKNDGKNGLKHETVSEPRLYNLIFPPSTLVSLPKNLKVKMLAQPLSEKEFPMLGHLMRLSRYNYFIYLTLSNFFEKVSI